MTVAQAWQRAAPIACGVGLAAGAVAVAIGDPAASGSRFPGCIFHATTGLWCPGCGITRGTHQLLNGHIGAALGYNIFTPVAIAAIMIGWFTWTRRSWGKPPLTWAYHWPTRWSARWFASLPAIAVGFTVLRNLPIQPFKSLAP